MFPKREKKNSENQGFCRFYLGLNGFCQVFYLGKLWFSCCVVQFLGGYKVKQVAAASFSKAALRRHSRGRILASWFGGLRSFREVSQSKWFKTHSRVALERDISTFCSFCFGL